MNQDQSAVKVEIAGESCWLHRTGALYLPAFDTLVVADLHFEKASSLARKRVFLPPYDSLSTLRLLLQALEWRNADHIVALGDSFHDPYASERLQPEAFLQLAQLQQGRDWLWIKGNHDPLASAIPTGRWAHSLQLGALLLCHEPCFSPHQSGLAGHFHPSARVAGGRSALRRKCFITDGSRCILPAFGALTGGLNIHDEAFAPLFTYEKKAYVLGREKVYPVSLSLCRPEPTYRSERVFFRAR